LSEGVSSCPRSIDTGKPRKLVFKMTRKPGKLVFYDSILKSPANTDEAKVSIHGSHVFLGAATVLIKAGC